MAPVKPNRVDPRLATRWRYAHRSIRWVRPNTAALATRLPASIPRLATVSRVSYPTGTSGSAGNDGSESSSRVAPSRSPKVRFGRFFNTSASAAMVITKAGRMIAACLGSMAAGVPPEGGWIGEACGDDGACVIGRLDRRELERRIRMLLSLSRRAARQMGTDGPSPRGPGIAFGPDGDLRRWAEPDGTRVRRRRPIGRAASRASRRVPGIGQPLQ